jgi:hypothetical protein
MRVSSPWCGGVWATGLACLALVGSGVDAAAADAPLPSEFAWRGTLALPTGASLVRVDVPVPALLRMQNSAAHDLRVFNAAGAVVPFALLGSADVNRAALVVQTGSYKAYPLFAATSAEKAPRGGVEVRVESAGQHSTAWVRMDNADSGPDALAAGAQPLQAALFDMRTEKQALEALVLALELPHNALVPITVSTSADLKDWSTVATKGPLFQFDGADAPGSTTLELRQPLIVQGRYLRLAWNGQAGVNVRSLVGRVASTQTAPAPVRSALPLGTADGSNALHWTLPFATPLATLHLQAVQDNTLVPVRIQGRGDAAQPWRTLASSVVYRLDTVGQGSSNPPTPMHGASVRALRVETSQGAALPPGGLQATVEFAPLQLAFLASGAGPFTLAAGRTNTAPAAVDASLLGSVAPDRLNALPLATVASVEEQPAGALAGAATAWLPAGTSLRSVLLWLVLGLGVLVLGAVAYSLTRQLAARPR